MRSPWPMILMLVAACSGRQGPPPPASEFLVAAGDSTFWITTGEQGISVRGAPIALARLDGRLYELYVTDDDRSYYDAVMIGQRLYRRDVVTGDSMAVLEDTTVARLATAYAAGNPGARRLEPDEEASSDPDVYATADLEIVAVHGPYLSFEHHSDIGLPDGREIHSIRRGVVDLRSKSPVSVDDVFGASEADRVIAQARQTFAAGIDSLLASTEQGAQDIGRVIRDLRFDPSSFTIARIGSEPAVRFLVPGDGDWALDFAFPMSPIRVAPPAWWADMRPLLPTSPDSVAHPVWDRPGTRAGIVARHDTVEQIVTLVLRDSTDREWKAAHVPPPVEWLLWLDDPPLDSTLRRGLKRAFDEAASYSDDTRIVMLPDRRHPGEGTPRLPAPRSPAARRVEASARAAALRRGESRARDPEFVSVAAIHLRSPSP